MLWPIVALAVAWLGIVVAVALLQDRLLYLPERASAAQMLSPGLRAWPSAADFRGLVAEPAGPARATALVLHGNAGHAGHREFYAQALVPLGVRVILVEYPGFRSPDPGGGGRA